MASFLTNLGERIGVDLTGAAASLGLDLGTKFTATKHNQETDFEPRTDIFENKDQYTIHVSLPGAKKSDVAVDYDGEHSTIRITGIVHRPEVNEQSLAELVVDGRKRETGVFEKAIRLGTKKEPASVDVSGISARMIDGVLIVKVPKVEPVHHKREVPIAAEDVEMRDTGANEALFDAEAEKQLYEAPESQHDQDLLHDEPAQPAESKGKAKETEAEKHAQPTEETLPVYEESEGTIQGEVEEKEEEEEEDWEQFSDENEGDYVKIAVN